MKEGTAKSYSSLANFIVNMSECKVKPTWDYFQSYISICYSFLPPPVMFVKTEILYSYLKQTTNA